MTRDELLARMKSRRLVQESVTWAQFVAAVGALTQAQKNSLVALLNAGKSAEVGSLLVTLATNLRKEQASAYVDAMAADDIWSTDNLLELLE